MLLLFAICSIVDEKPPVIMADKDYPDWVFQLTDKVRQCVTKAPNVHKAVLSEDCLSLTLVSILTSIIIRTRRTPGAYAAAAAGEVRGERRGQRQHERVRAAATEETHHAADHQGQQRRRTHREAINELAGSAGEGLLL